MKCTVCIMTLLVGFLSFVSMLNFILDHRLQKVCNEIKLHFSVCITNFNITGKGRHQSMNNKITGIKKKCLTYK